MGLMQVTPAAARYVAGKVLENREVGVALKSQAVLFRTSHHSAALEIDFPRFAACCLAVHPSTPRIVRVERSI